MITTSKIDRYEITILIEKTRFKLGGFRLFSTLADLEMEAYLTKEQAMTIVNRLKRQLDFGEWTTHEIDGETVIDAKGPSEKK